MKSILFVISAAQLSVITCIDIIVCDGILFNELYYHKQIIAENYSRPYNLFLHSYSDTLFFSHTLQNTSHVDFRITACSIDEKVCFDVGGVPGGYAIAYDTGNDDIFFGGHDGIYKYNFVTKTAEFFAEKGKSIWSIFIRHYFYYVEYPTQKLYVYQNGMFVLVSEAQDIEVEYFFMSRNLDIYFSNKTALFKVEKMRRHPVFLNNVVLIRQIVENGYGDIYFCASDGIYVEDKLYRNLRRVAEIEQAFGMAFDENDHVIYSDKDTIYRLVPSKHSHACYTALNKAREQKLEQMDNIHAKKKQ